MKLKWSLFPSQVNDASGRYGGGLFAGQKHRIVDRKLCDQLNEDTAAFYANVKANIMNITKVVPYPVQSVIAKYDVTVLGQEHQVRDRRLGLILILLSNSMIFRRSTTQSALQNLVRSHSSGKFWTTILC